MSLVMLLVILSINSPNPSTQNNSALPFLFLSQPGALPMIQGLAYRSFTIASFPSIFLELVLPYSSVACSFFSKTIQTRATTCRFFSAPMFFSIISRPTRQPGISAPISTFYFSGFFSFMEKPSKQDISSTCCFVKFAFAASFLLQGKFLSLTCCSPTGELFSCSVFCSPIKMTRVLPQVFIL